MATSPLAKIRDQINARLSAVGGNGRVYLASDIKVTDYTRRSSGIPSIDYILNGGFARGALHEFGGEYSSFKTTISLFACAHEQRTTKGAVAWVALEPFSKKRAREVGFFLPFSEELAPDPVSGEMLPIDPFANASEIELLRMQQAGITDPYKDVSPFMLVQDDRGDVALDAALDLIKSNAFAYVVVDSLGVAKSTKWLEENEVQDASDFSREPKMIGDYTTRALLALNMRYDENNMPAKDGTNPSQTSIIHLNHIGTVIGTQARAKHKTQYIKGGEGNKHNHHVIVHLSKGELYQVQPPGGAPTYRYAQEVRAYGLKSKLGPQHREGSFDCYILPYGVFQPGDIDTVKDLMSLAIQAGLIQRSGAWYEYGELKGQGKDQFAQLLRDNPNWYEYLSAETTKALRR